MLEVILFFQYPPISNSIYNIFHKDLPRAMKKKKKRKHFFNLYKKSKKMNFIITSGIPVRFKYSEVMQRVTLGYIILRSSVSTPNPTNVGDDSKRCQIVIIITIAATSAATVPINQTILQ